MGHGLLAEGVREGQVDIVLAEFVLQHNVNNHFPLFFPAQLSDVADEVFGGDGKDFPF